MRQPYVTRELLIYMYKKGMVSSTPLLYYDISEKVRSIPEMKLSHKVKIVAQSTGMCTRTIYRALEMF